jgi:uncharacterized Zn finger protein
MLSHVLAPQVSSGSRSRGFSYFRSGAVMELGVEDGAVTATVEGSEPYAVRLDPQGQHLGFTWACGGRIWNCCSRRAACVTLLP